MCVLWNFLTFCLLACALVSFRAVTVSASPQMVIYWGQNSVGSFVHSESEWEQPLRNYCEDTTYDIIVVSFVSYFPLASESSYPGMDFSDHCYQQFSDQYPQLLDCADSIGIDISYCQSQGKKVFISFGGGDGEYGLSSNSQGQSFAAQVWNLFLGGSSTRRPFGNVILDGIDLDIESGSTNGYSAFVTTLRTYFAADSSKNYYISAAPQCVYPDIMGPGNGSPFSTVWFDYIWIQFYNNDCGLDAYPSAFNFDQWAQWASTSSINPNVQLFIGAPAGSRAAGSGYVSLSNLQEIATAMYAQFPKIYGGVMLWDAGNADYNNNYGISVAKFVHADPSTTGDLTTSSKTGSTSSKTGSTSSKTGSISSTTGKLPITRVTTYAAFTTSVLAPEPNGTTSTTSSNELDKIGNFFSKNSLVLIVSTIGGVSSISVAVVVALWIRRKKYAFRQQEKEKDAAVAVDMEYLSDQPNETDHSDNDLEFIIDNDSDFTVDIRMERKD